MLYLSESSLQQKDKKGCQNLMLNVDWLFFKTFISCAVYN